MNISSDWVFKLLNHWFNGNNFGSVGNDLGSLNNLDFLNGLGSVFIGGGGGGGGPV